MFFAGMCVAWFFAGQLARAVTLSVLGALAVWCLAVDAFARQADPFHGQWAAWATAVRDRAADQVRKGALPPAAAADALGGDLLLCST